MTWQLAAYAEKKRLEAERLGITPDELKQRDIDAVSNVMGLPPPAQIDYQGYAIALVIAKLSKTPEGIKTLERIAVKFLDGLFGATKALCATAAGNDVSAWGAPVLLSAVYERFGMLPLGFNNQFHLGLSMVAGAEFAEEMTRAVAGIFKFTSTSKSENLTSITYTEGSK